MSHPPAQTPADAVDAEVAKWVASTYADPYAFVLGAYPWGMAGTSLAQHDGPDTWQEDTLLEIGQMVRERAFDGRTPVRPIRKAISSGHGVGKALSKRTWLHTPDGYRQWGTLRVGDRVFAKDGTPTVITGVYDQGERELYRVVFDDGSEVEADADHLWKVRGRRERRWRRTTWRTLTTKQLLEAGVTRSNGQARARQWEIPRQGSAQFPRRDVTIDPYALGAWLGDGGRGSSRITAVDPEVVDRLRQHEHIRPQADPQVWGVRHLKRRLRALGIENRYSYQKSVPVPYLENTPEVRAEVLRGLLDTDGECDSRGIVVFSSTSRALAEDVVWLARSLGGKARLQPTVKRPAYRQADGRRVAGRPCWRATLTMPADFRCFYITRKETRRKPVQARYLTRWIDRIEPIGRHDAMCITVAHPSRCFLANDFIVTHNSALSAWLVDWIMGTRPHAQGTVTANTITQLQTKTWAAVQRWTGLCLYQRLPVPWFIINSERMYHRDHKASWFCAIQNSKKENSEAFAGQHANDSTSFYLLDEASAIDQTIYDVAEGGLTDGEPMIFLLGNATRSSGAFHASCFGTGRDKWHPTIVDARTSKLTNKEQIQEWEDEHGEDSDFFRVRVRGLPPRGSDVQFIDYDRIWAAQKAPAASFDDDPLIAGVDVSDGGSAWNVVWFRRGHDARSIPPIRLPGEFVRGDRGPFLAKLAEVLNGTFTIGGRRVKVAHLFIDAAFGAPYAERLKSMGHKHVTEVRFGSEAPDPRKHANMRAYMWDKAKDWLLSGAIPTTEQPGGQILETDLAAPGFHLDKRDRLVIESKESMAKRGVASPDNADALVLTFAAPVKVVRPQGPSTAAHRGPAPPRGSGWLGR